MTARNPVGPAVPEGINYVISEDDVNRLWRAQHAATLLAALSTEAVHFVHVSRDSTAAVAEYIAWDVMDVLKKAQQVGPTPTPPRGPGQT